MRAFHPRRIAILALTAAAALASAGCPELNRYPDRSTPGQFSVDDPAGRRAAADATSEGALAQPAAASFGPVQFGQAKYMVSEEGGLPDQSRRAH